MNTVSILRWVFYQFALCALLTCSISFAQEHPIPWWVGVDAGYGIGIHSSNDLTSTRDSICPRFTNGIGGGPLLGISAEWRGLEPFRIQAGGTYYFSSVTMQSTVSDAQVKDQTGNFVPLVRTHSLAAYTPLGMLDLLSGYSFGKPHVFFGVTGQWLAPAHWQASAHINSPSNVTYGNSLVDTTYLPQQSIDSLNRFVLSLTLGAGYDIPLSERVLLVPELAITYPLTPMMTSTDWKQTIIRLEASLRFGFGSASSSPSITPTPELAPPPAHPEPAPVAQTPPPLTADVTAYSIDSSGVQHSDCSLRTEEFVSTRVRPLLNYIFFDDNSAVLPERYMKLTPSQADSFRINGLHNLTTLDIYYNLLNIIGRRLRDNPNTTITITGCNSNTGAEKEDIALSRARTEPVRNYLRDVWNIPESRMKTEARNLPAKASNANEPDGIEENRRVEITSNSWDIMAPVITNDTDRIATYPIIRYQTYVSNPAKISSWDLKVMQKNNVIKDFTGVDSLPSTLSWDLRSYASINVLKPDTLQYSLDVHSFDGRSCASPTKNIPVSMVTIAKKRSERAADREIDRFSLILFDFDKSSLSPFNNKIIDIINNRITPEAQITITGYTDRTGEFEHDQGLSLSRAQEVAKTLKTGTIKKIAGLGASELLYDNNLPEGRFYCRTVNITAETPIKE